MGSHETIYKWILEDKKKGATFANQPILENVELTKTPMDSLSNIDQKVPILVRLQINKLSGLRTNSITDLEKDLDISRQMKNLN